MPVKLRTVIAIGFLVIGLASFFVGRRVEQNALAAASRKDGEQTAASPTSTASPEQSSYRQLAAVELLALPFAQFYEALRSAPGPAREKWAVELEKMPDGPRKSAGLSAFYKLLVQFDPKTAAKNISEIKDKQLQNLAFTAAANAAPGSEMSEMAELALSLQTEGRNSRDPLWDVLYEWMDINPVAVAQFLADHPKTDFDQGFSIQSLIFCWAARDPKGAEEWMERNRKSAVVEGRRAYFEGWYETDPAAVTAHLLAHFDEPEMKGPISNVLGLMYVDSPDGAKKFMEALPDESSRRDAFRGAFESCIVGEEEDLGEPNLTPRALGEWMMQFPPEYWKGKLSRIFEWTRSPQTSQQMLAWIAQQPPAIRDSVAAEYAKPFLAPIAEAVAPLLQIPDTKLREQLLIAMFKHGNESEGDVKTAIEKMSLTPEQRDYLQGVFEWARTERTAELNRQE